MERILRKRSTSFPAEEGYQMIFQALRNQSLPNHPMTSVPSLNGCVRHVRHLTPKSILCAHNAA